MRKFLLLFFLPFIGFSQGNKLDQQNGFNVYIFETPPNGYKDLTLEIDEGNVKLYSLDKDPIIIASVEFEYVHISFFKNKLSAIAMRTKNGNGARFLQSLKEAYGQPIKPKANKENYEWSTAKLQLIYEINPSGKDATISFYNKTLYKK